MTTTPTAPSERAAHARHGYSSYQITLHWTVATLVVVNLLLGGGMSETYEALGAGQFVSNYGAAFMHICVGVTIFLIMIARLTARLKRPVQTAADTKHPLLAKLGMLNHWAFYGVLLVMPPLGVLAWFAGAGWAGALHSVLAWVLIALMVLHVGGAIVHLVLGENIIRRIVRPTAGT